MQQALNMAMQHHAAGQLAEAENLYNNVLRANPNHSSALHLLGVLYHQAGKADLAVELISKAVTLQPNFPEALNNLGNALLDLGRLQEAVPIYARALEIKPDYAMAHFNLGNALQGLGKLEDAAASYGNALSTKPDYVEAHHNRGVVLQNLGRFEEAVSCYRQALEFKHDIPGVHAGLGESLHYLGRLDEAVASYHVAVSANPNSAELLNNLGSAQSDLGLYDEAAKNFRTAAALSPMYAEAHYNLGRTLKLLDQLDDAIDCYRKAVSINPEFSDAYTNLGIALSDIGLRDEAVSCFEKVCELDPASAGAYSNVLVMEQYRPGQTTEALFRLHQKWQDRYGKTVSPLRLKRQALPDPDRRLRIGFMSADLGRHPVGYFVVGLFEKLLKQNVETIVFSDRVADDLSNRIKTSTTVWHDVNGMSDENLTQVILDNEIDILFDLSGHLGSRLNVIAAKPAPIQVAWAGYVGTTGLSSVDYLLSDVYSTPPDEEQYYSEKIIRMPDGWLCYEAPDYAPQVGPLPSEKNGFITFASFSNPAKINEDVVTVWSRILDSVENSRLFIKCKGGNSKAFQDHLGALFGARGIDRSRLSIEGRSPHADLLACYNDVDIALDTFPYSGGLTTYEALWMGVPVITAPGETFASRHSLSHLSTIGLPELVARDHDEYVELALGLASHTDRLAGLRAGLRQMMAASPICDSKKFADGFAANMRAIWRDWCATQNSSQDNGERI